MKQRMRRISALLLVVLMCVSLVVPAFAADGAKCPDVHTKSNCSATQIGDPHPAGCGEQGYTAYQCNDCGAYFADDFVEAIGEDHAWQIVTEEPTCTKDGYYKQVCLNCGKEEIEDAESDPDHYKAYGHTWALVNEDGTCEDGLYCVVCDATADASEVEDNVHAWGEPVLDNNKAPTHVEKTDKDGKVTGIEVIPSTATVTCELCGLKKTVKVYCDDEHLWAAPDAEKAPTCSEPGARPGQTCKICGKTRNADGTEYDPEKDEYAPYEEIAKIPCDSSVEWVVELPTCTTEGSAYKICTMCREAVGVKFVLNPIGHNYQTKVYKEVTTGGYTADQIAMFEALSLGKSAISGLHYSILVQGADGAISTVTGTCNVPTVLDPDKVDEEGKYVYNFTTDTSKPAPADPDEKYYEWTGEFVNDDPTAVDEDGNQQWMHWATSCYSDAKGHFYTYVCTTCKHSEPTVNIDGHYWVETGRVAPDCAAEKDGSITYTCANPYCDGKNPNDGDDVTENAAGKAVKTEVIKAKHFYVATVVAPTCVDKGYTQDICIYCHNYDPDKADEGQAAGKYDILDPVADAHSLKDNIIKAPTCTVDGLKAVYCELCEKTLQSNVTIPKTGHDLDKTVFAKPATAASCTAPGYNYYYCKNENCPDKVVAEVIAAQLSHDYSKLEVTKPNCATKEAGYTTVYCKHCNQANPNQIKIDPVPFDVTKADHHTGLKMIKVIAGNCTTLDTVYYECVNCDCNDVFIVEEEYITGHGAGHVLEKVAAVAATCFSDGAIEYYKCKTCGYLTTKANDTKGTVGIELADTVVSKLTKDGKCEELVDVDYVAATCTEDGNEAGQKCTKCGTLYDENGNKRDDLKIAKKEHKLNATTSAWVEIDSREENCTEWGYSYLECSICGEEKIVDYVADLGGHKEVDVKGTKPTCSTIGWTDGKICSVCGEWTVEREVIAKLPHKNEAGEEFFGICTETLEDRLCVVCEADFTDVTETIYKTDKDGNIVTEFNPETGKYEPVVLAKDTVGYHEWVRVPVEATCMSYSYTLVVCKHCHFEYMTDEGFEYADEHLYWGEWVVEKPATALEEGKKVRKCTCGATEEQVIPALSEIEFELDYYNTVVPGADIVDGGLVSVDVNTVASTLDVWGLRITLKIDNGLSYKGFEVVSNKFEEVTVNYVNGTIVIIATAPTVNGKLANVTLDKEETLVTLNFKTSVTAEVGDTFTVGAGGVYEVIDEAKNYIELAAPEAIEVEITAKLLDVVADGERHIDDLKALKLYITGESEEVYNAACDSDFDGEITANDYKALLNILKFGSV